MADTGNFALHRLQGRAQPPMLDRCVVERRVLVGVAGQLLPGRFQRHAVLPAQNIQRFPQAMALGQQFEKNRSRRPLFVQRDHVEKLLLVRSSRKVRRRTPPRGAPDLVPGDRHRPSTARDCHNVLDQGILRKENVSRAAYLENSVASTEYSR